MKDLITYINESIFDIDDNINKDYLSLELEELKKSILNIKNWKKDSILASGGGNRLIPRYRCECNISCPALYTLLGYTNVKSITFVIDQESYHKHWILSIHIDCNEDEYIRKMISMGGRSQSFKYFLNNYLAEKTSDINNFINWFKEKR